MKMVKANHFGPRTFSGLMEDFFNGNTARFFRDDAHQDEWNRSHYQVPVNIRETEAGYALEVIAPGVAKEDFKLQVNDKVLTISFEQKEEAKEQDGNKWLRKEFRLRSFKRSFTLGEQVDIEKIAASYEQGILHLELPKKEAVIATNKVIEIR